MQYISLVEVLRAYGEQCNDGKHMKTFGTSYGSMLTENTNLAPFTFIEQKRLQGLEGQPANDLTINNMTTMLTKYSCELPDVVTMPPILEMEWMNTVVPFEEDDFGILYQLAYHFVLVVMGYMFQRERVATQAALDDEMERDRVFVEVDDLSDTPAIISNCDMLNINFSRIKQWNNYVIYADSFVGMFKIARQLSNGFKSYYAHMPVMLSLFLMDYYQDGLKNWTKENRLEIENEIKHIMENFTVFNVSNANVCTYNMSTAVTTVDVDFVCRMFELIHAKLHSKNSNIGLITYNAYSRVRGPETITAKVLLCDMNVDWEDEMERMEAEENGIDQEEGDDL